ncbi:MAG: UDP-3-O-[3-hydroxymyristoyl] N-acetylglucosamine deacetylase [Alphaproteobacteria bacterium]|nr:UDP-3-O-[3-hydroxymyristoyl] N-acetylglucosamine deacetylase [Alphaproteobacteria bacterium]NCQ66700.1 UDP-3-O-[3-hydroxymyristoyl] N-acetylglucosamine deacetylase [Alphaproteobacteria bacterium]NCT07151.1 UDP-3-O-[3-hydroxymyristoyl] N-acetylglucosamine deacetylase [Alphaproteobacteria bacterium]
MHSVCPKQTTLKAPVSIEGIGVHSALPARLELVPLAANMGIIFERTDLKTNNQIVARITNVADTSFSTTLGNAHGVTLSTVEHLMAALSACQISNVLVKVSGPEMPIMDGSSAAFVNLINTVGIVEQDAPRKIIRIIKPLEIKEERRWVRLEPAETFSFQLSVDFGGREGLQPEDHVYDFSTESFATDISQARSFGFYEDAQKLYAAGLAKGSSLDNAVVIKKGEVMNKDGLRYKNEMVRHKILDAMGDFYLTGSLIQGRCVGFNIGHEFNNRLMRKLLDDKTTYELIELAELSADQKEAPSKTDKTFVTFASSPKSFLKPQSVAAL